MARLETAQREFPGDPDCNPVLKIYAAFCTKSTATACAFSRLWRAKKERRVTMSGDRLRSAETLSAQMQDDISHDAKFQKLLQQMKDNGFKEEGSVREQVEWWQGQTGGKKMKFGLVMNALWMKAAGGVGGNARPSGDTGELVTAGRDDTQTALDADRPEGGGPAFKTLETLRAEREPEVGKEEAQGPHGEGGGGGGGGGGGRDGAWTQMTIQERAHVMLGLPEMKSNDCNAGFWEKLSASVRCLNLGTEDVKQIVESKCPLGALEKVRRLTIPASGGPFWDTFRDYRGDVQGAVGNGSVTWGSVANTRQREHEDPDAFLSRMEERFRAWAEANGETFDPDDARFLAACRRNMAGLYCRAMMNGAVPENTMAALRGWAGYLYSADLEERRRSSLRRENAAAAKNNCGHNKSFCWGKRGGPQGAGARLEIASRGGWLGWLLSAIAVPRCAWGIQRKGSSQRRLCPCATTLVATERLLQLWQDGALC
ncbi:hypothetical protein AAFF_G00412750 [Aldrovandia affinis]|uniref:Uncharacterized protein n=1 Tax=Aldrovandia affinis TaxID=143900 RepID=A0AAD7WJH8_9TELE|nr:hypothetical protein AAFF_G00412750 [Aldrovandia affinis]